MLYIFLKITRQTPRSSKESIKNSILERVSKIHTNNSERSHVEIVVLRSSLGGEIRTWSQGQFGLRVGVSYTACKYAEGVTHGTHQKFSGKLLFVNFLVLGPIQELLQNFSLVHAAGQERWSMSCRLREGRCVQCVSWLRHQWQATAAGWAEHAEGCGLLTSSQAWEEISM